MNYKKTFGKYLRKCRIQAGMTQEALAERCGLSIRQIYNIENGKSEPKLTSLSKLCKSCNIEFDNFIKEYTSLFQPPRL